MTIKSVLLLTARILRPKETAVSHARKSLFGAVLCIALSMIPLVVVLLVSDGMIGGITGRIIGLSSYHAQIAQSVTINSVAENQAILENLEAEACGIPGVTGAFIERQGSALAAGKNGRSGAVIRAVSERFFTENRAFSEYAEIISGTASFPDKNSAVIGKKIAETLGLAAGDTIRLISARTTVTGTTVPRVMTFTVSGIVSSGYQEIDALWVFVPFETGFSFLSSAASSICVGIETEDPFDTVSYEEIIMALDGITPSGFHTYRWADLNATQFENFASTRLLLLFIMFLIVLVASVNISSALVMLVMERRKEIAILKSLGASPAGISCSYILTGAATGCLGVIIGIPLGVLCAVNVNSVIQFLERLINLILRTGYTIVSGSGYAEVHLLDPAYYLESIPVTVSFPELAVIAVVTVLLSMVVSILPAVRAGKEKPLDILRKI